MTKQQAISALILAEVAKGKTVREAVDQILGQGTFLKVAGDVYDAIKGRQ